MPAIRGISRSDPAPRLSTRTHPPLGCSPPWTDFPSFEASDARSGSFLALPARKSYAWETRLDKHILDGQEQGEEDLKDLAAQNAAARMHKASGVCRFRADIMRDAMKCHISTRLPMPGPYPVCVNAMPSFAVGHHINLSDAASIHSFLSEGKSRWLGDD